MGKKGKTKGGAKVPARKDIAQNRKALHEYEILDRYEAGIALTGTEVKGLRESGAMIREAYAQVIDGEVFLVGAHISDYGPAGGRGHDPQRTRRLLLHRREIDNGGDAGKILQQHTRRLIGYFPRTGALGQPVADCLDVVHLDAAAVLEAQQVFKQNLHRIG